MPDVLYLIDSMDSGGAEISLVEILPALRALDVTIELVALVPGDPALVQRLRATGQVVHDLSELRWPAKLRSVWRLLRSGRFDLVHTTLFRSDIVGRVLGLLAGLPVVSTLANTPYGPDHRANSRYGAWSVVAAQGLDIVTARLATRLHAVSAEVADTMSTRLRVPREQIVVVHRGRGRVRLGLPSADRRAAARSAAGVDDAAFVVLTVARFDKQKGVEVAVDAVSAFEPADQACLLVAGRPGNDTQTVENAVARSSTTTLLGPRSDIGDLMCAADVLCAPTRWEGLPGVVLEAMAMDLPVVASDIGPVREALGGTAAALVRVDDRAGFTAALQDVCACPDVARSTAQRARERFEATFSLDRAAAAMAALYSDVTSALPATVGSTGQAEPMSEAPQ